jgi:Ca2+-binding EF-hand superfamily protein
MSILPRSLLAIAVLGGLLLAHASAHESDMFATMDSNHDGRISMQEHDDAAKAMFTRMDGNRDGRLTAEELHAGHRMMQGGHGMADHDMPGHDMPGRAMPGHDMDGDDDHDMEGMHQQMAADMMARMDANHDGGVTAAENEAAAEAMFAKVDADHDGKVTATEMAAGHGMMMREKRIMHRGNGGPDMLAMMDADHDGAVTEAEHAAAARSMFTRADSNHDSYVTQDEMKAFHAQMGKDVHHAMDDMEDMGTEAKDANDKRMDQDTKTGSDKNGT